MADQTQRLEIATVKAEIGSEILSRFSNDEISGDPIPTDSGDIPNLKQVIVTIQENGAEKISFATTIYSTTAAGIAATTDGGIFLVKSADADEIYAVWQNVAAVAVDTGKRALSATAINASVDSAATSAEDAQGSADLAAARVAPFLGPFASSPITRNDSSPLQEGDEYQNTVDHLRYNWTGTSWVALNSSAQALEAALADPNQGARKVDYRGVSARDGIDLSGASSKYTVRGGQIAHLRSCLEDPFWQYVEEVDIGDSITWGMTVAGGATTDPRTGALTDPRNNMTSPSWANLYHQWLGRQFFRMSAPTSVGVGEATYVKTLDLWPATPHFTLSAYGVSEGVLANTNATLRFYIDYVNDGKSITWSMYGGEFVFVYSQLGNGADYELFVDGVSQGTFTTAGSAAFKSTRIHTFAMGQHKVQIVKRGSTASVLRIEAIRVNKTLVYRNQGIIGRDTVNWLPGGGLLDAAITSTATHVRIMLGTNNRGQNNRPTSPTKITEDLFSILAWLQNQRPLARPILMCANEADQDVGATYFYDMHAVRRAISNAAQAKAVDFIDLYEVTREALTGVVPYLADGLHPNTYGHLLMSRGVINPLRYASTSAFGDGLALSTRSALDLNDPSLSGEYYAGSATTNKPVEETAVIESYQQGDGRIFQWFLPLSGARPFLRIRTALGAWVSRELALRSESLQVAGGAMNGVFKTASYTLATLPPVGGNTAGLIWVSDLTGGAFHCYCDGSAWRRMDTKAIAS